MIYKVNEDDEEIKGKLEMKWCMDVRLVDEDLDKRQFEIEFKDRTLRLRAPTSAACVAWVINLKVASH